ncbi:MAG: hypothetical protein WBV45_12030 [Lutimonas sp.]
MKNIIFAFSLMTLLSCGKKDKEYRNISNQNESREVIIEKSESAGNYTYLSVTEGDESYWIAVSGKGFETGETIYFKNFMEMNDFESKELDKTFETILFVDNYSREPDGLEKAAEERAKASSQAKKRMDAMIDSIKIAPAPGGISIAELYGNPEKYKDKQVVVRGQIIKINRDIMDKNWVHIMDGTRVDRSDLTFTTTEDFQLGDTITIRGKVALDKDFGAGYVYPLIVEEAKQVQ